MKNLPDWSRRLPNVNIPNTRVGASVAAGILLLIGFTVGLALLFLLPMARSGQGVFAYFIRPRSAVARIGPLAPAGIPTPGHPRPELWVTPIDQVVFPSQERNDALASGASVVYVPGQLRPLLMVPPINDALGRGVVAAMVSFGVDDDQITPAPLRPDSLEPTQLTILATPTGGTEFGGCVLVMREEAIRAIAGNGSAGLGECQDGTIRLPNGGALGFSVTTDVLPNRRSRDGAWREGGVFGRTTVRLGFVG